MGRNESERMSGFESREIRRPSWHPHGEGSSSGRNWLKRQEPPAECLAAARGQGSAEQLEKPSWPRVQITRRKVGLITDDAGKWAEGQRVADGFVVPKRPGNAGGGKGPYW